jgi:hypothetical protein
MKFKISNKILIFIFLSSFVFLAACSGTPTATPTERDFFPIQTTPITKPPMIPENGQYFPTQTEIPKAFFAALTQGELVRDELGYLRVNGALMLWQFGFSCVIEGDNTWMVDDHGNKVLNVGDFVKIGGGEISKTQAQQAIGELLPENCKGPYYLVSEIVP